MKVRITDPVEHFVALNIDFLNRILNNITTSGLAIYLECNKEARECFYELKYALIAAHDDPDEMTFAKKGKQGDWVIDREQLQQMLDHPQSSTGQELVNCMWAGLESWQLQLVSQVFMWSYSADQAPLQALIWLEKNRSFIKKCVNQDPNLYQWLNAQPNSKLKKTLVKFTAALHQLFSQTVELKSSDERYPVPKLMDVRKLWYSVYGKYVIRYAHFYNALLLLKFDYSTLAQTGLIHNYHAAMPSAAGCFLETINGYDLESRHQNLPLVSKEILMWLFIMHPNNKSFAELVVQYKSELDKIMTRNKYKNKSKYSASEVIEQFNSIRQSVGDISEDTKMAPVKPFCGNDLEMVLPNKTEQVRI